MQVFSFLNALWFVNINFVLYGIVISDNFIAVHQLWFLAVAASSKPKPKPRPKPREKSRAITPPPTPPVPQPKRSLPNIWSEADSRNGYKNEKVQERSRLPLPAPTQIQSKGKQNTQAVPQDSTGLCTSQEQEDMMDSIYDEPEAQLRSGKGFKVENDIVIALNGLI